MKTQIRLGKRVLYMNMVGRDYRLITQRNFVSELEHRLRAAVSNDDFLDYLCEEISLSDLAEQKQFEKLYYVIALVRYLNFENIEKQINYIQTYDHGKLEQLTYANGVEIYCKVVQNDELKQEQLRNAIPEFLKYNLVVTSVGDVV